MYNVYPTVQKRKTIDYILNHKLISKGNAPCELVLNKIELFKRQYRLQTMEDRIIG